MDGRPATRLRCYRCGAHVVWLDYGGTPLLRCPEHPDQAVFRAVYEDEDVDEDERVSQGELSDDW